MVILFHDVEPFINVGLRFYTNIFIPAETLVETVSSKKMFFFNAI